VIIHTLIYQFPEAVDARERELFFAELRDVALGSGLVLAFGFGAHQDLPADGAAHGMTASAIVQFACADLAALREFSELPHVHSLIADWRARTGYRAAYANHEPLLEAVAR
jgi:aromatase